MNAKIFGQQHQTNSSIPCNMSKLFSSSIVVLPLSCLIMCSLKVVPEKRFAVSSSMNVMCILSYDSLLVYFMLRALRQMFFSLIKNLHQKLRGPRNSGSMISGQTRILLLRLTHSNGLISMNSLNVIIHKTATRENQHGLKRIQMVAGEPSITKS